MINLNSTIPAAPAGNSNVTWQSDTSGNVSAYVTGGSQFGTLLGTRHTAIVAASPSNGVNVVGDQGNLTGTNIGWVAPTNTPTAGYLPLKNSSANTAGSYSGAGAWLTSTNLQMWCMANIGRITDCRIWIGLFNTAIGVNTIASTDAITTNDYAAFRFSTVASDAAIECITCDGSAQNIISSSVTADLKSHNFGIKFDDTNNVVNFYIDNVLVATSASHLPRTNKTMYYVVLGAWASSAPTFSLGFTEVLVQSDF